MITLLLLSKQVLVPGNIRNTFLDNLIPDTPYSISVSALYADGEGPPVSDTGKTRRCNTMTAKVRGGQGRPGEVRGGQGRPGEARLHWLKVTKQIKVPHVG